MSELVEIFGKIVGRFDASKMAGLNATVQFDLGTGNQHHLIIANGTMKHGQGMAEKADATLTMASEDFVALTKGQLNPMNAFMSGKIKVAGDMGLVMKLQSLLTG